MIIEPNVELGTDGKLRVDHDLLLAIAENSSIVVIRNVLGPNLIGGHRDALAFWRLGLGLKDLHRFKRTHIAKPLLAFIVHALRCVNPNQPLKLIAMATVGLDIHSHVFFKHCVGGFVLSLSGSC